MYATAHRVSTPGGDTGINAFLHKHGRAFEWPTDPSDLPEIEPGVALWNNGPAVAAPGGRVHSYLDVLAPDDASAEELDQALTGLWLHLVAEEVGTEGIQGALPNPLVYRRGRVVVRFGVEHAGMPNRALEMAELRRAVDPGTARWFAVRGAG
jgi:hypothetical protein